MQWHVLWEYHDQLLHSFLLTSVISVLSIIGCFVIGTVAGCIGALPWALTSRLIEAYVELMRNIPAVIPLFFFYFLIGMNPLLSSVLALTLHHSAYIADITSAGFRSIPREQFEAGIACGHSYPQIFRFILIPQGFGIIVPSMTSQFIAVVKNSAICMLIGTRGSDLANPANRERHFSRLRSGNRGDRALSVDLDQCGARHDRSACISVESCRLANLPRSLELMLREQSRGDDTTAPSVR